MTNATQSLRLYSFTANLYLSPLQLGLQTAHLVGELSHKYKSQSIARSTYFEWAEDHKTIIILGAANHAGVLEAYAELDRLASALSLPYDIFHEDEQSMNSMATVCGVVVPQQYFDVLPSYNPADKTIDGYRYENYDDPLNPIVNWYPLTNPEGQFCHFLKSYRLA